MESEDQYKDIPFDREYVYEWDGEGIPALVEFVSGNRLAGLAGKMSVSIGGTSEVVERKDRPSLELRHAIRNAQRRFFDDYYASQATCVFCCQRPCQCGWE